MSIDTLFNTVNDSIFKPTFECLSVNGSNKERKENVEFLNNVIFFKVSKRGFLTRYRGLKKVEKLTTAGRNSFGT